jgi:hypothetical protein
MKALKATEKGKGMLRRNCYVTGIQIQVGDSAASQDGEDMKMYRGVAQTWVDYVDGNRDRRLHLLRQRSCKEYVEHYHNRISVVAQEAHE